MEKQLLIMTTQFSILPATESDVATILNLIRQLSVYEKLEHMVTGNEAMLNAALFGPTPSCECVIAREGQQPIGFALFFTTFSTFLCKPGLYLEDLFVIPAARGHGRGKALLKYLAGLARNFPAKGTRCHRGDRQIIRFDFGCADRAADFHEVRQLHVGGRRGRAGGREIGLEGNRTAEGDIDRERVDGRIGQHAGDGDGACGRALKCGAFHNELRQIDRPVADVDLAMHVIERGLRDFLHAENRGDRHQINFRLRPDELDVRVGEAEVHLALQRALQARAGDARAGDLRGGVEERDEAALVALAETVCERLGGHAVRRERDLVAIAGNTHVGLHVRRDRRAVEREGHGVQLDFAAVDFRGREHVGGGNFAEENVGEVHIEDEVLQRQMNRVRLLVRVGRGGGRGRRRGGVGGLRAGKHVVISREIEAGARELEVARDGVRAGHIDGARELEDVLRAGRGCEFQRELFEIEHLFQHSGIHAEAERQRRFRFCSSGSAEKR